MLILGLTGSIGMGKSATASMLRAQGVPVFDSDAAVHDLYRGEAAAAIEAAFPGTAADGIVDRVRLGAAVLNDPAALARLEAIVHPLVRAKRTAFVEAARKDGRRLAVFDVPLLFETGAEKEVDMILVVSASFETQRARVLARPGMDEAKFAAILKRQTPDAEKRARAHFILDTGRGLPRAERDVKNLVRTLAGAASAKGWR